MKKKRIAAALLALGLGTVTVFSQIPAFAAEETSDNTAAAAQQVQTADPSVVTTNGIEGWPQASDISSTAAIVMETSTNTVLYSKNADQALYPASAVKVMTCLLALENSSLDDQVTMTATGVSGVTDGGANISAQLDEVFTMEQCLYAIMIASANDIALQVAELISGSVDAFVQAMNTRAQELGCTDTVFTNPTGLPDENHYTTAHDMALIAQAAYNNATFRKVCQTTTYCIGKTNKCGEERWLSNHHKMLPDRDYTYEGCTGGKTGFTQAALNTLVTYAERNGRRLVCVSLRTNGRQIYTDTASLLDYGFNNFQNYSIFNRKTWADAKMLYPSLYFGQPETVANLRPTCTVTLPAGMDLSSVETTCNPGDGTLCRSYTYNQYPVGSESITDTAIQALLHSEPINICKKSGSAAASDLGNSAKETASGIFQKVLAFVAPVGTIIISVFTAVPWYYSVLGGMLLLIIIMEIVLAVKKKKRRKKKKKQKRKP